MKRKSLPAPEEVVAKEILEKAKEYLQAEVKPSPVQACVVCGSDCAPNSTEQLCWVCRRLKISAWRDNDTQLSAQE